MDLTIASVEDRQKWDDLIANSFGGTLFHTLKWLKCMETHTTTKIFGHSYQGVLIPMVAREGAVIVALIPLFLYSGPGVRIVKSGSYSDDTIYLGPVFMESGNLKPAKLQVRTLHLQKALDNYIKNKLNAQLVTIRFSPFNTDARPFIWDGYDVEPAHTYIYNLESGVDAIWSGFTSGVRREILNAQKSGISVEQGGIEDAEFIYDKLAVRNRINSSRAFILEIIRSFTPDNCNVFIAKLNGKRLTGIIVLHYGNYAYLWIGFPSMEGDNRLRANELLMWEVIKWAHSKGYHILENSGADDITTFPFKRKFNPNLQPYFTIVGSSFVFRSFRYLKRLITPPHYELERNTCGE
jgi:hypothetical protein